MVLIFLLITKLWIMLIDCLYKSAGQAWELILDCLGFMHTLSPLRVQTLNIDYILIIFIVIIHLSKLNVLFLGMHNIHISTFHLTSTSFICIFIYPQKKKKKNRRRKFYLHLASASASALLVL